ncbi:protein kinase [Microbispora sp. RL4-1S]|uniref:non-specific serine/threonine protein kinase n=1 Tax=Microbispora oryzae TaxID=2806554 RepID=A0A941AGM5_9ACTN|nr:serine/threonine-protein kinase [Microbispora oryzae]MBP2703105.1 protein kinase [Microbispora oryzae]
MYGQTGAWRVPGYTEIRELGTGGGGRVVLARHDPDDLLVAIKYLSAELMADLHFVARFRHEARLLAAMDPNPNSARFYEYVEVAQGAAIVMELIDGVSLRAMIRSEGPTGPEAALAVLKGSLLGLAAAHEIGVVHRDYKPENVMITADGTSKLVDFGIAAQAGEGVRAAGTPPYMAPEQWEGGQASPATDVYAATVVFFECLTGGRPFRAQSLAALARQHHATPPPIDEVPPPLRGLIQRGMAKHPADRPRSAQAFLEELEAVAAEEYGPAWENRGRRRLAALAGLLLPFFPLTDEAPEVGTSLAETRLGGLLGRGRVKVGLTLVAALCVIGAGTAALVGTMRGTTLQAAVESPTPVAVEPVTTDPDPALDDDATPPDDASPTPPEASPVKSPAHTPAATQAPPAPPTVRPTQQPTRKPSPKPTKKPTSRPTTRPTRKPTPSPASSPEPTVTADLPGGDAPKPTPAATTSRPTPSTPPASSPPPTSPSPPPVPRLVGASPSTDVPSGTTLAAALVTTGLVPATLAVKTKRGRQRRRR